MQSQRTLRVGIAAVGCALICHGATAGARQVRIDAAKSLRCTFKQSAIGNWQKDGAPSATLKPSTLVLRYESIDADSGTAVLRTGTMLSEITVRLAEGYLHLMQSFRSGPLYTTTVFDAEGKGGPFKAVHSRHEYFTVPLPGATSSPEQYYGECEVVN
jgi:hypothetical protein